MSFECEHCGFQNNEIQSGSKVEDRGIRIKLKAENEDDLNRTLVKSDFTSVVITELDFEIPAKSQKGGKNLVRLVPVMYYASHVREWFSISEVTTVEGVIDRTITGLLQDQEARLREHPDAAAQIAEFTAKLTKLKTMESPFTMVSRIRIFDE